VVISLVIWQSMNEMDLTMFVSVGTYPLTTVTLQAMLLYTTLRWMTLVN